MDEKETVTEDQAQLDHLEKEITEARRHLDDQTHLEEKEPYLYEDDQEPEEGPGNENVPA